MDHLKEHKKKPAGLGRVTAAEHAALRYTGARAAYPNITNAS